MSQRINCIVVDDEEFSRTAVRQLVESHEELHLVAECESAIQAFKILKKEKVDLVFLDVEMPGMTGMELVEALEGSLPHVVLITSRKEYAVDAFEYGLSDYIVKPVTTKRFLKAVQKVQENLAEPVLETQGESEDMYVKSDGKIVRVKFNDILFVEALSDYVIINSGDKRHIVHSTMKGMDAKLPSSDFIRVHRSYIINISKIDTIEDMQIVMPQKNIPIGASYKNNFLEKINLL